MPNWDALALSKAATVSTLEFIYFSFSAPLEVSGDEMATPRTVGRVFRLLLLHLKADDSLW